MKCAKCNKDVGRVVKGLCKSCYEKNIYQTNPIYREKMKTRARDYCRRKCKEDPSWNALHQKQYRMTHPENYGMMQIRYYMKKISPERQMEILKKFGFRKEKEETPTITTNNHDNDLLNGGE